MSHEIKFEDLPPKLRQQAAEQLGLALGGKNSRKNGKPQPSAHDALENGSSPAKIVSPVFLVVLCYRTRIRWDADNVSIKPFLDGLVAAGILEDDSTKQIKGLLVLPKTCRGKDQERTELEFWSADYFEPYIESARRKRNLL